jgi:hypothetical protein
MGILVSAVDGNWAGGMILKCQDRAARPYRVSLGPEVQVTISTSALDRHPAKRRLCGGYVALTRIYGKAFKISAA